MTSNYNRIGASDSVALASRSNKRGLAARYNVGVRTIEAWHAMGILRGVRNRRELVFDVLESDQQLFEYLKRANGEAS